MISLRFDAALKRACHVACCSCCASCILLHLRCSCRPREEARGGHFIHLWRIRLAGTRRGICNLMVEVVPAGLVFVNTGSIQLGISLSLSFAYTSLL